jgi:hypothetical protein
LSHDPISSNAFRRFAIGSASSSIGRATDLRG